MHIITMFAIIINIIAIVMLLIGLFCNFKKPKNRASYGYFLAGSMSLYMFALSLIAIYGLAIKHNFYCLILFLCVLSPFVIGKFVKYETLKKYTIIQTICFAVSLVVLMLTL